jgi:ubiquinone/menaquinone biosynthesis C-methylase UbiE
MKQTSTAYSVFAKTYDWIWKGYLESTYQRVTDIRTQYKNVLDVSAGTAKIHEGIVSEHTTLLDMSADMLKQAKKRLTNNNTYIQADVHNIPLENNIFDTAFCISALQHYTNPKQAIKEIHRVLVTNGELILIAWTKHTLLSQMLYWALQKRSDIHYIETPENTIQLIEESGFSIHTTTSWNYRWWGLTCIHAIKN